MTTRKGPALPEAWFARYEALANDIVQQAKKRKVLLVTHKGNWGDALIVSGARNFLQWYGIGFREISGARGIGRGLEQTLSTYPPSEYFPVFTAGGSISPLYGHAKKLRNATLAFEGGLVLPATCGIPFGSLNLHPNSRFWVRDLGESAENHGSGQFCHDMAFFTPYCRMPKLRNLGVFMRRDRERPETTVNNEGFDLSALGNERSPVWAFLAIVGSHRRIKTNRLHIAVAATICRVPCDLYEGSSSKISDVYDASLAFCPSPVKLKRY